MAYVLYHKKDGVLAIIDEPVINSEYKNNNEYVLIPCNFTDDVSDIDKWTNLANDIINNGYSIHLLKEWKLIELMNKFEQAFEQINFVYPKSERDGWNTQEDEAKKYLSDITQDASIVAPVLYGLVQERGNNETVKELAEKVLLNASIYKSVYIKITGKQQKMYKEINAITNTKDLNKYVISFPSYEEIVSKLQQEY